MQLVQSTYTGEIEMSDIINSQGYLISHDSDSLTIYSPYTVDDLRVFGYDSDYTTIAISLIKYLLNNNIEFLICEVDEKISFDVLKIATGIELVDNGSILQCNDDASVCLLSGKDSRTKMKEIPWAFIDMQALELFNRHVEAGGDTFDEADKDR